ncbi:MAG: transposase family protein, partial [Tannerellaceae bacterium]|nr:transposase family protein [Tannerellaceae bacterium]
MMYSINSMKNRANIEGKIARLNSADASYNMKSPVSYFSNLIDPRVERRREHDLEDILFIAIALFFCGVTSWYDMEEFGKAKAECLKTFLRLPGGIPSHDTFNRVFSALE